jgi:hypothetical protein
LCKVGTEAVEIFLAPAIEGLMLCNFGLCSTERRGASRRLCRDNQEYSKGVVPQQEYKAKSSPLVEIDQYGFAETI